MRGRCPTIRIRRPTGLHDYNKRTDCPEIQALDYSDSRYVLAFYVEPGESHQSLRSLNLRAFDFSLIAEISASASSSSHTGNFTVYKSWSYDPGTRKVKMCSVPGRTLKRSEIRVTTNVTTLLLHNNELVPGRSTASLDSKGKMTSYTLIWSWQAVEIERQESGVSLRLVIPSTSTAMFTSVTRDSMTRNV